MEQGSSEEKAPIEETSNSEHKQAMGDKILQWAKICWIIFCWPFRVLRDAEADRLVAVGTLFLAISTFALAWVAHSTDEATHTLAEAAKKQLTEMQANRRPWLEVAIGIKGPLKSGPPIELPLQYIMRNVGPSPAIDAWVNVILFINKVDMNLPEEMHKRCEQRRERMLTNQSQSKHVGYTLFPNKSFSSEVKAVVEPSEYEEWKATDFGKRGWAGICLVVCGDYRTSFAPEVHSTQAQYWILSTIPDKPGMTNAILNMNADIGQEALRLHQEPWGASYAD